MKCITFSFSSPSLVWPAVLLIALLATALSGCNPLTNNKQKGSDLFHSGQWMFYDFTYPDQGDYTLGFVQGAGVSRNHYFIYQSFKQEKEMLDSSFYWSVNGKKISDYESILLRDDLYFARESYSNPYYNQLISPTLFIDNQCFFTPKDSLFLTPPLCLKYTINNLVAYNPADISARQNRLRINPLQDKVKIEIATGKTNPDDITLLTLTYVMTENDLTNEYNRHHSKYFTHIENPEQQKSLLTSEEHVINRYLPLANSDTLIDVPMELFEGLDQRTIRLLVYRGNFHTFSCNHKKIDIFNISVDGTFFEIVK